MPSIDLRLRLYVYFVIFPMISLAVAFGSACVGYARDLPPEIEQSAVGTDAHDYPVGLMASRGTLDLPISPESSFECVQGPGGEHSHAFVFSRYAIDLDLSEIEDEPVFSPVRGRAYVHEDSSNPLGPHVNIERDNGTFVVLGHLKRILIRDGQSVSRGQYLGLAGCHDECASQHLHIGLQEGNARRSADYGVSLPMSILVAHAGFPHGFTAIHVDNLACASGSADGRRNRGLFYSSALDTPLFHPNGSLVTTATDGMVYMIERGRLRGFKDNQTLRVHRWNLNDVALITQEEFDCYGPGPPMDSLYDTDAFVDPQGQAWLVHGSTWDDDRYRMLVPDADRSAVLASWGFDLDEPDGLERVRDGHLYLTDWPVASGTARLREGTIARERDRSDVYVISDGAPVMIKDADTLSLLGFADRAYVEVGPGGLLDLYAIKGSCRTNRSCIDRRTVATCGGDLSVDGDPDPESVVIDEPSIEDIDDVEDIDDAPEDPISKSDSDLDQNAANAPQADAAQSKEDDDASDEQSNPPEPPAQSPAQAPPEPVDDPESEQPDPPPEQEQEQEPDPEPEEAPMPEDHQDEPPAPDESSGSDEQAQDDLQHDCSALACLKDRDNDGRDETFALSDTIWIRDDLSGLDAYVYGNGGCFNSSLEPDDLVVSTDGKYEIDFSRFHRPCSVLLTLISSVGTDGEPPDAFMLNWNWWQNGEFCWRSTPLCELMNNGMPWEEWLFSLAWHPDAGLVATGNAFTRNDQLP
jgi:hypothetical protein